MDLITYCEQDLILSQQLLAILQQQQNTLEKFDLIGFEQTTQAIENQLSKVIANLQERNHWQLQHGYAEGYVDFEVMATQHIEQKKLRQLKQSITEIYTAIREQQQCNSKILTTSQTNSAKVLNILLGKQVNFSAYDKKANHINQLDNHQGVRA